MPLSCDPKDLAAAASCFQQCVAAGEVGAIKLYLLRAISGLSARSPSDLANDARCFDSCIPIGMQRAVENFLLCTIVNNGGGGGQTPDSILLNDTSAENFSLSVLNLLASVSAPNLASVTNDLNLSGNPLLATINLPSLATVGGGFFFSSDKLSGAVSFPSLVSVASDFSGGSNLLMTSLSLPAFNVLGGSFFTMGSTALVSILIPQLFFTDGATIDCSGCALNQASVDLVLHRAATSVLTISSINLSGGTNSAPSALGIIDKNALILAGCTVNTN